MDTLKSAVNNHTLSGVEGLSFLQTINHHARTSAFYLYLPFMNRYTPSFSVLSKFIVASALFMLLFTFSSCEKEEPQGPSSDYYITYTWEGDAEYIITYWLQSTDRQYVSLNTGSAANQGSYTSPVISHANDLNLAVKTAIQYTSNECANVQMTLYRDSLPVLTRDYIMGNPDNQNCTGENFRQATYTP